MAIQGQEGSGIPDYLNLSAYAQTINAQASLANKIELVKPQGHTQTTDAQAGHAQTSNAQTGNTQAGHTQTGNAQTLAIPSTSFNLPGHAQASNAQAGHTQTGNDQAEHTQAGNAELPATSVLEDRIDVSFSLLFFQFHNSKQTFYLIYRTKNDAGSHSC